MDFKLLGSILLIVGTSIGAGMLALPVVTAELGFYGSVVLLISCWFLMTSGAYYILEANLWMPHNSNLITMARSTLGPFGQMLAWLTYFLLLYSLICAYIAGGSDLFHNLVLIVHFDIPQWVSAIVFTVVFGLVVFLGIRIVDYVNRGLMFIKFFSYFILLFLLLPFVTSYNLRAGDYSHITSMVAIMVTITSFGYAAIVPSLRVYFAGDIQSLKKSIFIGSLIPLFIYLFWDMAIMGVIPLDGTEGLLAIFNSKTSTSDLVNNLTIMAHSDKVTFFARLFTSICVLTSFLGVSLCLADFLADGLHIEKEGLGNIFIHLLVYLPPLAVVMFYPSAFIKALEYAGIYCVILLVFLPAWITWNGRYRYKLSNGFTVAGGKLFLGLILISSLGLAIYALLSMII